MHSRQSKLFESGGEIVKRNLMEQYSMSTGEKKKTTDNVEDLKEQVFRLSSEVAILKTKPQMKNEEIQFSGNELLNDIIKQKDRSIDQYEKQILSFKNMILQKNNQVKELLNKLSDPLKKSQIMKSAFYHQESQTFINQISQSQQTEVDLGLLFGVKSQVLCQNKYSQTEAKFYSEIMMLNQDQMYQEIEQYKKIMRDYDLENRELKEKLKGNKIDQECQSNNLQMIDFECQQEDSTLSDFTNLINDYSKLKEENKVVLKKFNEQTRDFNALKKQYDDLVSDYYFLQSESKANQKQIRSLNDEIETLKQELQSNSSAETVTSPKDSQKSSRKRNLNPKNVDELILAHEDNQKLQTRISELKSQLLESQRNLRTSQEDILTKDQIIQQLQEQIIFHKDGQEQLKSEYDRIIDLENKLTQSTQEIKTLQQRLTTLNSDYLGMKVINQTLHMQLEKYQNRNKLNSP